MMETVNQSRFSPGARLHQSGGVSLARRLSDLITGRPGRAAASMFILVIAIFTGLLSLPFAAADNTGDRKSVV